MEYENEISSSEGEFDFSLLNDEIISIDKEINDRESNNKHRNEIRGIRKIINSESEIVEAKISQKTQKIPKWIKIGKYSKEYNLYPTQPQYLRI